MHRTLENEPLSVVELKILFRATRCGILAADVAKLLPRPVWQIEELMANIDDRTYTHGRPPDPIVVNRVWGSISAGSHRLMADSEHM